MRNLRTIAFLRSVAALLILASVAWQICDRVANNLFRPWEYFSFFTVQTSLIAVVMLAASASSAWRGRAESRVLNLVRLCSITFTVVVALVYNLLLRGLPNDPADGNYQWPVLPNEILHVWAALFLLVDWILYSRRINLRMASVFWVLLFPLAWLTYSIVRGLMVNWWPYWFINPNEAAGIPGMLTYIFGIMIFLLSIAVALIGLQRLTVRVFRN